VRIIRKLNNVAYCGFAIHQALEARERCMQKARNEKYWKGPGYLTELPYNVMMARRHNRDLVEQLKLLRQDTAT